MFERNLKLPPSGTETFFLWGQRQVGKSTLLKQYYKDSIWIDLLKSDVFRRYLERPELLRKELEGLATPIPYVVIDELQKLPVLLDEVQWLHENKGIHFCLCGSSARKLKRGSANLLGGRAVRLELFGFNAAELGNDWDLNRMLNHGTLPRFYLSDRPRRLQNAYVANYLKEEIAAEALVRNLPVFSSFLNIAALSDTETINYSNIAQDCGVSNQTIKGYFSILEDTLLGRWLPAYSKRPKRRIIRSPKFYFADVGLVNFLAKRGSLMPGSDLYGKAFENWCYHELASYNAYQELFADFYYWRLASGIEVDFIVNQMELAIEVKASAKISNRHLKGLRQLKVDHPEVAKRIVVCLEDRSYQTNDGIQVYNVSDFIKSLWSGVLF
jgi:predicted AAA+ superfamily ATPase